MIRPRAINVTTQPDYCLLVTFNNGEKRIFDVKPYLDFKPFAELKKPHCGSFSIDGGFGGNFLQVYDGVGGHFTRSTPTSETWLRMP